MKIFSNTCLYFIMLCHFLLVCFIVITPFTNCNYILLLHSILVPFIMLHWILNDNTCVLTLVEKKIRTHINGGIEVDDIECFTCQLINPIYDFKSNYENYSTVIYLLTIILWLTSVTKLVYKYCNGDIKSFIDLFIIK